MVKYLIAPCFVAHNSTWKPNFYNMSSYRNWKNIQKDDIINLDSKLFLVISLGVKNHIHVSKMYAAILSFIQSISKVGLQNISLKSAIIERK